MDVRHNHIDYDVRLFNAVALKRHQDDDEKKNPYRMVWVLVLSANADVDAVRVVGELNDVKGAVTTVVLAVIDLDKVDEASLDALSVNGPVARDDEIALAGDARDYVGRQYEIAVLKRGFGTSEEFALVGDLSSVIDANGVSESGERGRLSGLSGHDPERMMDKSRTKSAKKLPEN